MDEENGFDKMKVNLVHVNKGACLVCFVILFFFAHFEPVINPAVFGLKWVKFWDKIYILMEIYLFHFSQSHTQGYVRHH